MSAWAKGPLQSPNRSLGAEWAVMQYVASFSEYLRLAKILHGCPFFWPWKPSWSQLTSFCYAERAQSFCGPCVRVPLRILPWFLHQHPLSLVFSHLSNTNWQFILWVPSCIRWKSNKLPHDAIFKPIPLRHQPLGSLPNNLFVLAAFIIFC